MGRYSWYTNASWNDEIEATFFNKLKRARWQKPQYLRIQAGMLAQSHPEVALRLLDLYFELGDKFDNAQAHVNRANAFRTLGLLDAAVASLEAALAREKSYPNFGTRARIELAMLIVVERKASLYGRANELLNEFEPRLVFPIDSYHWNGAHALLLRELGQPENARLRANIALQSAELTHSGIAHHPDIGLVGKAEDEFRRRLTIIAGRMH